MRRFLAVLAGLVSLCTLAMATTIAPCGTCWQTFDPTRIADTTGSLTNPYFVNQSQDGPRQGLGFQLGQFQSLRYQSSGNPAPADAPAAFYFLNPPGHQLQAQFLMGITQDNLELGWYDVQNPSNLNPLFTRTGSPSATVVVPSGSVMFTPTPEFGFYVRYLNVPIPGNICAALLAGPNSLFLPWNASGCYDPAKPLLTTNQIVYTQTALNSTGPNTEVAWEQLAHNIPATLSSYHQHFVALQDTNTGRYIIGMEDTFGRDSLMNRGPMPASVYEGNGDYQDFVITFGDPTVAVPEPSYLGLLGLALGGFALRTLRSRHA